MREAAFDAIRAYRDGGAVLPPPPSRDEVREMLRFMIGEDVDEDYEE